MISEKYEEHILRILELFEDKQYYLFEGVRGCNICRKTIENGICFIFEDELSTRKEFYHLSCLERVSKNKEKFLEDVRERKLRLYGKLFSKLN